MANFLGNFSNVFDCRYGMVLRQFLNIDSEVHVEKWEGNNFERNCRLRRNFGDCGGFCRRHAVNHTKSRFCCAVHTHRLAFAL